MKLQAFILTCVNLNVTNLRLCSRFLTLFLVSFVIFQLYLCGRQGWYCVMKTEVIHNDVFINAN